MSQKDAELGIAFQLLQENPNMVTEQALAAGAEFVKLGSNVQVLVDKGERKGVYIGPDRGPQIGFNDCF